MQRRVPMGMTMKCAAQFGLAVALAVTFSCSGDSSTTWLQGDLQGDLPEALSELGLYSSSAFRGDDVQEDGDRFSVGSGSVHRYAPQYPLWTNGSLKYREVVLPKGTSIEVDGAEFTFPVGSLFFKTFAFTGTEEGSVRPVETRVIRKTEEGWEYGGYLWNEEGTEAFWNDLNRSVRVGVTNGDGLEFEHRVPSRLDCRTCHESHDRGVVLGFGVLQLDALLEGVTDGDGADGATQLEFFAAEGLLEAVPSQETLDAEGLGSVGGDAREVLAYVQGNCVHCHNGGDGPNSAFSMRPKVFFDHVVGVATTASAAPVGIRVVAGDPESSVLFRAVERQQSFVMPPLGVEQRDDAMVDLFRDWIASLDD